MQLIYSYFLKIDEPKTKSRGPIKASASGPNAEQLFLDSLDDFDGFDDDITVSFDHRDNNSPLT